MEAIKPALLVIGKNRSATTANSTKGTVQEIKLSWPAIKGE